MGIFLKTMQKEVFLAIFVGFAIGLLVTFGVWKANLALKSVGTPIPTVVPEEQEVPQISKPTLNILSPPNELLSKDSKITLKGSYAPSSQIAVIYEKGEKILTADENGDFETEISLILGENLIEVYGFTKDGNEAKQILTIVHSTADI